MLGISDFQLLTREFFISIILLLVLCFSASAAPIADNNANKTAKMTLSAEYNPDFWLFGSIETSYMPRAKELGFMGVGYWAADRNGEEIKYYFKSPEFEKYPWAIAVNPQKSSTTFDYSGIDKQGSGLKSYAEKAHKAGLKVMANMEALDPYHWEPGRTKWTPELLAGVVKDLHNEGADRWFTECVAGWPKLFIAIADACKANDMVYQEGSDPGYIHRWDDENAGSIVDLYPRSGMISMYHYNYKREEKGKWASQMQEASLGYAFARGFNLKTAFVNVIGDDWGENPADWEGLTKSSVIIRSLQFRVDEYQLISETKEKLEKLDVPSLKKWAGELVKKNTEEKRPILNIVVHLRRGEDSHWRDLASSADAITSGAFHAGYDVIATTKPLKNASAYYVYTTGTDKLGTFELTPEITSLFSSGKKVFLQLGAQLPTAKASTDNWGKVISLCGINSNIPSKWQPLPGVGKYNGKPLKVTGIYTAYTFTESPKGTLIPASAVTGNQICSIGEVPLIIGKDNNTLILANCIRWQVMEPISYILNDCGVKASSDVWGIGGKKVSAFLAIHDTNLDAKIPGVKKGSKLHIQTWDRFFNKKDDETISYAGSLTKKLNQYDFVLIEKT